MGLKPFPKLPGPLPIVWGTAMLALATGPLWLYPEKVLFAALNSLVISAVLAVVIVAGRWLTRVDRNFLLVSALVVVITTYGLYQGFSKLSLGYLMVFQAIPALVFYLAMRIFAFRYAWAKALEYADQLGLDDQLVFADLCRTLYKRRLGALQAGAEVYRSIAEEALQGHMRLAPIHIAAMQKYAHMLIYGEAKGMIGEGEWYAKKAHDLSLHMLRKSDTPPTVH